MKPTRERHLLFSAAVICIAVVRFSVAGATTVVDTGQETCYDVTAQIPPPAAGEAFYGQDAQYFGPQPCYRDNGDGTVTDLVTGLMWQQGPGDKMTYDEAVLAAASFQLAGYDDWRLPSIKELYSLILFSGIDPSGWEGSDPSSLVPFLDTDYFQFQYGDPDAGERLIDAQYWSATQYVGTTMNGDATTFGVNFADGRIKGYPSEPVGPPGNQFTMTGFVKYVRGPSGYGVNSFVDNGDGTVTDLATGLMWQRDDNGTGQCWQEALAYAETLTQGGYDDWRLPDAKELQSIVDYTRSPSTSGSAAIDPVFSCTSIVDEGGETNYPFYWTGTTHANWTDDEGQFGVYVAFGEALGFMESPPNSGNYVLMDVHGAGAQRSDPKEGNPEDYPHGHGPQGDVVRIYNFARCVRGTSVDTDDDTPVYPLPSNALLTISPNPFKDCMTISFWSNTTQHVSLKIFDLHGRHVSTMMGGLTTPGTYCIPWHAGEVPSGTYVAVLRTNASVDTRRITRLK